MQKLDSQIQIHAVINWKKTSSSLSTLEQKSFTTTISTSDINAANYYAMIMLENAHVVIMMRLFFIAQTNTNDEKVNYHVNI